MRALVVMASTTGTGQPDCNSKRTTALQAALSRANKSVKLVLVPAGYWTAPDEASVHKLASWLVAELAGELLRRGAVLLGGIDALPHSRKTDIDALVKQHALPFWGFGISEQGKRLGPWRQVSTTRANSTSARDEWIQRIEDRAFTIAKRRVLPLLCGEMHNARVRQLAAASKANLVAVSGHWSLGQGLKRSLMAVHAPSRAAVVHVQHLAPNTRGSVHWVRLDGSEPDQPVMPKGCHSDVPGFWVWSDEITV